MPTTTNESTVADPSIVIAWGSSTGYTEEVATGLMQRLGHRVDAIVDIGDIDVEELMAFDVLILGVPTWHVGELQDDWECAFDALSKLDLQGKAVALFGCGDAYGYPLTFQDAMGILWRLLEAGGARLIGKWPSEGYDFVESRALTDEGKFFVGLAIDEHNQGELTDERLDRWAVQLQQELETLSGSGAAPVTGRGFEPENPLAPGIRGPWTEFDGHRA